MQLRPKIIRCNIDNLGLLYPCTLTFKEYKFLTTNIGHLTLGNTIVKDENDQVVPVEDLLACIPNCYHFDL
uniref:Uncharacterized protein n=1 Tax=Panagrolaimus superbus TaxID=310955 RepID=A0A914Y4Y0_9BILA